MTSALLSNGPRLPPGLLNLTLAVGYVGPRVCQDWDGTELSAAIRADEGAPLEPYFEPTVQEEQPPIGPCVTCGQPATRVRDNKPYCRRHGKMQPIPKPLRKKIAGWEAEIRETIVAAETVDDPMEGRVPVDQAALYRWSKAHAAIRDKVLAGELPAALREPGGFEPLPGEQWRSEGFPAWNEALVHHACRGKIPMHVVFETRNLDREFPPPAATVSNDVKTPSIKQSVKTKERPGPNTNKTAKLAAILLNTLKNNEIKVSDLRKRPACSIAAEYGVGQTAALQARKTAIAEFCADASARNTD